MFVFVIMPFADDLTKIYNDVVKPILEAEGCTVKRADEFISHQNILKDIIPSIFKADLIIAELTRQNPNVYYELGIAHSLNKPTILLVQNVEELLFDLASYRAVPYSENYVDIENLKTTLKATVQALKDGKGEFGNPVSDHLLGLKISIEENIELVKAAPSAKEVMDYSKEIETALYKLLHSAVRHASLLNGLSSNFKSYTKLVEYAGSIKNTAMLQQSVVGLDRELDKFADEVAKGLPNLRKNWETVKNGFITILMISRITTEQDIEVLKTVKSQLENVSAQVETLLPSIKNHNLSLGRLNETEGIWHPSVGKAQTILDEEYEIYFIGSAYLVRIENLIERKLREFV